MKLIREGTKISSFYLPVRYYDYGQKVECYFFLWAWLALLLYIANDIFIFFWRNLLNFSRDIEKLKGGGKNENI